MTAKQLGGAAELVRVAKWTLIAVAGLGVVLAATIFVVTSVIDPNRYRGKIAGIVSDLAGRPFVIDGRVEVTWYPWLGLRTGRARLGDRPGGAGAPLIEWQSVSVGAKVLPLLRGQLVVDRIRLQSPHVRLRRDAEGHGNWEGLGGSSVGPSAAPQAPGVHEVPRASNTHVASGANDEAGTPRASSTPGGSSTPGASGAPRASGTPSAPRTPGVRGRGNTPTQIAGLEVRDGLVEYEDAASGLRINLSKMDLDMGEWRADQSLPVHARFLVRGESLPPNGVRIELDTRALSVTTEPVSVTAPELTIRIADAVINGSLAYDRTAAGVVNARGSLAAHAPSLRKLATDLAMNQTMPHDPSTLGQLELTTQWSYTDGVLAAKPLALKLDGVSFKGWVERGAPPRPGWRFELHGDRIDLDRYINVDSTSKKPFELEILKDIDANGSLIFDEALLADARLSGVRLQVQTSEPGAKRGPSEGQQ